MGLIRKDELIVKNIFSRILNKDFSGNTGLAVKNSLYQFLTNTTSKIGSLVFIILLARIILPETFGLYNLVFSTIMFFYVFSDLGVNSALIFFSSKNLTKSKSKAKAYINYLFKIKLFMTVASAFAILLLSKFIADTYYSQPVFLALVAGSVYIFFTSMQSFYLSISQSNNDFKNPFFKELFFQVSKIILIPSVILYLKDRALPEPSNVLVIISLLSLISVLSMLLIRYLSLRNLGLSEIKPFKLGKKEISKIKKYIFSIALISSSVLLFGNIDKIILGPFVPPVFVGYYSAAFNLVNASAFLLIFSDVFFPIFLRIKGAQLKNAFDKSVAVTLLMSSVLLIILLTFSPFLVNTIFGHEYSSSINMLRMLSVLALLFPLIELYTSYIISQGNLDKVKKVVLFILVLSILLPLIFVKIFSQYSDEVSVFGLILGVILSKAIHLFCLIRVSRNIS